MAKLIVCRDYKSNKEKKTDEKTIVGYKLNLTKTGVEEISKMNKDSILDIEYKKDMIIITKKK